MKTCAGCKISKDEKCFGKSSENKDGLKYYCKACRAEEAKKRYAKNKFHMLAVSKKWRDENKEKFYKSIKKWNANHQGRNLEMLRKYRKEHKERYHAHMLVGVAKIKGVLIVPDKCERCNGSELIEAHHADYSKPYEVTWLCRKCHRWEHSHLKEAM